MSGSSRQTELQGQMSARMDFKRELAQLSRTLLESKSEIRTKNYIFVFDCFEKLTRTTNCVRNNCGNLPLQFLSGHL